LFVNNAGFGAFLPIRPAYLVELETLNVR